MLSTSHTVRGPFSRSTRSNGAAIPARRKRRAAEGSRLNRRKRQELKYWKRRATGVCVDGRCANKPEVGHTRCGKHLRQMSQCVTKRRNERMAQGLCIVCGERPKFWGHRCIICHQPCSKNPLPYRARRALRLYREAESLYDADWIQAKARLAVRKLLASGEINGNAAKALRLYAGLDSGKWWTYSEVGELMHISKEWVRRLLEPSKIALGSILGDNVPWRTECRTQRVGR